MKLTAATGESISLVAGVDEVGRGPLAGPVVAAAVILHPNRPVPGLADSKTLSPAQRELLDTAIRERAFAWALGRAEVAEIDTVNILQATLLAMQRAVLGLKPIPQRVLVDGTHCPVLPCPTEAIVKGDQRVTAIAAASIIAKVARDREMGELDTRYPGYGFAANKGYPTKTHISALSRLGISPVHRRSFQPVQRVLGLQVGKGVTGS